MSDKKDNAAALYPKLATPQEEGEDTTATEPEVPPHLRPAPRLRPNGDLVLIRRLEKNEKTEGGIILPPNMKNDFFRAEVLDIGKGHFEHGEWVTYIDCEVGDIVLVQDERIRPDGIIHKHLIPVTPDDKQFVLCPGSMIYAVELPQED